MINEQAEENEQRVQAEMSEAEAREKAAAIKTEGNELFKAKDFDGAAKKYTDALKVIKQVTGDGDSVLYANRAAAYMGLKRWVPACRDGILSADCDPDNWKAYWRQGVSLMSMVPKRFRTRLIPTRKHHATQAHTSIHRRRGHGCLHGVSRHGESF